MGGMIKYGWEPLAGKCWVCNRFSWYTGIEYRVLLGMTAYIPYRPFLVEVAFVREQIKLVFKTGMVLDMCFALSSLIKSR